VKIVVINDGRVVYSFVEDQFLHDWCFHSSVTSLPCLVFGGLFMLSVFLKAII